VICCYEGIEYFLLNLLHIHRHWWQFHRLSLSAVM